MKFKVSEFKAREKSTLKKRVRPQVFLSRLSGLPWPRLQPPAPAPASEPHFVPSYRIRLGCVQLMMKIFYFSFS